MSAQITSMKLPRMLSMLSFPAPAGSQQQSTQPSVLTLTVPIDCEARGTSPSRITRGHDGSRGSCLYLVKGEIYSTLKSLVELEDNTRRHFLVIILEFLSPTRHTRDSWSCAHRETTHARACRPPAASLQLPLALRFHPRTARADPRVARKERSASC